MDRDYSKLSPADAPWLTAPGARAVCDAIGRGGHQILFVGGCVRNALLGVAVSDVDLATSARPEEVVALARVAGLKPVPTGIDHGTITVVADGSGYEITTFRRDVETDGRRAVVAYSTDIHDDARRRDFTMNALYADATGQVIDPLGGLADLRARRVRFIEDAEQRIREDYLRTLRYFRFHAWYGNGAEGLDPEALAAIGSNLGGLETLSAERVGAEMKKLLSAPDPSTALAGMSQTGVLGTLFPGADMRMVPLIVHAGAALDARPDWISRLVALGGSGMPEALRMSRADQRRYHVLKQAIETGRSLAETAFEEGADIATQLYLLQCAISESPADARQLDQIQIAAAQSFPVVARDLMPTYEGAALGARLAALKAAWIASGFSLTKAELLDRAAD